MGALTIAFDTTIVGVLALPWVLIVIHLFFFEGEERLGDFLKWLKDLGQPTVVGVLLFAMTYTLGSAVSRTARDFFNDDDLRVQVGGQLFRVGVTEDRIVASVYCSVRDNDLLRAETDNPVIAEKLTIFKCEASPDGCRRTLTWSERQKWVERKKYNKADNDLIEAARDLFSLQENSLMEKGGDYSVRLRQLHDQVMVLRGAAFNGLIAFSLCVFAWGSTLKREKPRSWLRLALAPAPAFFFAVALIATVNHFGERAPSDPPYMEFTLLLLALVGAWLVWIRPSPPEDQAAAKPAGANQAEANQAKGNPAPANQAPAKETSAGKETGSKCYWQKEHWARLVLLSAILSAAAILGWWSTEVIYAQQVNYSYDSQSSIAPKK
jgi:hypothetical protein